MILKFKCAPSNYREVQLKPHWGGNNLHPAIHLCLGRGTAPEVERSLPQHCKPTCTGSSALFCVIQGAGVLMNPSERHYQNAGGSWRILRQMFAAPILPDPCPHTHPTQSSPPPPAASLTVQVRSFSPATLCHLLPPSIFESFPFYAAHFGSFSTSLFSSLLPLMHEESRADFQLPLKACNSLQFRSCDTWGDQKALRDDEAWLGADTPSHFSQLRMEIRMRAH